MTRALACAAAVCLVLAGCGSSGHVAKPHPEFSGPLPPTPTPQPLDYAGGVQQQLKRGAIAVVDLDNRVVIAPSRIDVNSEQRMSGLRWTGWGSPEATARGDVRTLICDPNCATGLFKDSHGELVLSAPKTCGGRRFYTRASMTYEDPDTHKTRAPATYLRTPAC